MTESIFNKHSCDAMVIHCIDFRFGNGVHDFIKNDMGLNCFDIVSLAGGAKNLASPAEDFLLETVLENTEISQRLHHIKKIILVNHMDCGAYGGSAKFENLEAETEFHKSELEKAAKVILEKFPNMEIVKIFAYYEEDKGKFLIF
ncbi:hypothetical protein HY227_02095 [Candidatus Wolfebacteria bacterium]|nr:hypothetical protein [Candidatus Wolfebacteria bacterium]